MEDVASDLNGRIAACVKGLRASRGWTLDDLAATSGVSRSMISVVERGESSATAVILDRIATGLGITLPALFAATVSDDDESPNPVSRRRDQPEWRDPGSGYLRRVVSPTAVPQPMQIVEVEFPAGVRVAFETGARHAPALQQIWVLHGAIDVIVGPRHHRLDKGDCLAMTLNAPTMFHNPTTKNARYAVVILSVIHGGSS